MQNPPGCTVVWRYSAVAQGSIVVRDQANQQQDVAALSRDTEHANDSISPIFDKEKEQKRLQTAQLIGEPGSQVADIARTQGQIEATEAGKKELAKNNINQPDADAPAAEKKAYQEALENSSDYKKAMALWGTGSDIQKGIQAATAAIQRLAGGNLAQAASGAAAPYLAEQIHKYTADNQAAKAMAHAVVGAVTSWAAGNSAAAGATGAVSGELMGQLIMHSMYPGKQVSDLQESDKQIISALSTLAAGLAGGVTGGSSASALAGAQAGKNAVENNALGAMAGSDLGFWLGKTPECDTACKAGIAKGVAEGNLVVSAGVSAVAGGATIVAATPEIAALAKAALEGCKVAPRICLNNAGLQVAEAVTPGGVGVAGAIGVGKTAVEAMAAKAEAVAANTAKNSQLASNSKTLNIAEQIGMLRDAAKGNKGNFGLGNATTNEANILGEAWVGPGYRISKDGTSWVSADGLRVYRPPSAKPNSTKATTGIQANFEQKVARGEPPISNGHLDIIK